MADRLSRRVGRRGNVETRTGYAKELPKRVVEMIDEFFAAEIDIVENGISRRVSNFEAIVLQLWRKAVTTTSKRAVNVLLKYLEFAASRGGMRVFALKVVPDKDSGGKNG